MKIFYKDKNQEIEKTKLVRGDLYEIVLPASIAESELEEKLEGGPYLYLDNPYSPEDSFASLENGTIFVPDSRYIFYPIDAHLIVYE